ncbi:MAG: hypothetical protein ACTSRU_13765, partial [Candidatus Hodarchaeales archaeon]
GYVLLPYMHHEPGEVADAVWLELLADHEAVSGSMAETLRMLLGLGQENFWVTDQVYDDDKLTSCTIKIFDSAADCLAGTGEIAEYGITTTYSLAGKLTLYKSVKL